MRRAALGLALVASMGSVVAAEACQGSKVLFTDQFATALDPSWGSTGPELKVEGGRMVLRLDPTVVYWQTNDLADYTDVDACVDVTFAESGVADEVLAGLVFWYVDDDNLSVFQIDAAGNASYFERIKGDWKETIPWADTSLVPMGDGKPVRLRAVIKGNVANIYVDDQKLTDVKFEGRLPAAGTKVGIIAGAANTVASTIAFDNFALTAPN